MIIGLTGKKHHGKTTASNKIIDSLLKQGLAVTKINFKDSLINTIKDQFPDTLKQLGIMYGKTIDELFEEKPPIMRALMQNVGTDVYRRISEDFWIKEWENKLIPLMGTNEIITDDVRFLNEAQVIRKYKSVIIRIERDNFNDSVSTSHMSELEMDKIDVDYTIKASTKEELEEKIYQLILTLNGKNNS